MAGVSRIAVSPARCLLERQSELADLASDVAAARGGNGRLVLVEGSAGVGKSALLGAARSLAQADGLAVARARGTELERGFAFGVVRQLYEPLLRACSRGQRTRLLGGSAGLAGGVFGIGDRLSLSPNEQLPEVVHGLYWLTLNLSERHPLLVLIDDAHWADQPSWRFLSYLAGRLDGVAVLVVVAARPAEAGVTEGDALAVVAREPSVRVAALTPLSAAAVAELVESEYGRGVAPEFARACHRATGGNPFLLRELIRALQADGIDPSAADAPRVAREGPASVARSALTRVAALSSAAPPVARALAVLGGEAELRDLARLGGLDAVTLEEAVELLAGAGIVVGADPVAFVHPIVHASIYADIPAAERRRAHLRAARGLATEGAAAERVAAHLLSTRPAGDPWTVRVLSQAASDALARGAPDGAIGYLARALAELPAGGDRHRLLALLGRAQYLARQPGAGARLLEAIDATPTAIDRGELALQAAKALIMSEPDRSEDAIRILDRAIADLDAPDSQLSMRLEAHLLAAAGLKLSTRPLHRQRMDGLYPRPLGDGPAERLLLANLASWTHLEGHTPGRFSDLARHARGDGTPADVARRVAERAIAGGALLREEGSDSELFYFPVATLLYGDFLDPSEYWLEEAIEDARTRGSVVGYVQASAELAEVAYRRGALASAEAHARAAASVSHGDVLAVLVNILLEQGRLDEAARLLERYPLPPAADHFMLQPIVAAAGRLKTALGQTRAGADQLLACGGWLENWGAGNPGVVAWRSTAALALHQLKEPDQARELAAEEVALAQALGQPRALGIALRALGLLERGTSGIDLLEQAITELEHSPARLEHARALIDYGAALRREAHRVDARKPLRAGLDLAHRCGATALRERAHQELLATGARPRRPALTGRDALTPTEARIGDMAARGLSTPEIAQALFVTPRTVETHLWHVYRKLDIHTRRELPSALSQPPNPYT
jgi:DNA-binding CsgD family transcriptional regulator